MSIPRRPPGERPRFCKMMPAGRNYQHEHPAFVKSLRQQARFTFSSVPSNNSARGSEDKWVDLQCSGKFKILLRVIDDEATVILDGKEVVARMTARSTEY